MSTAHSKADKKDGGVREMIVVIVQALLIAVIFRTFLFQPFNIPSGSMMPSLLIGDYVFVSKFSYGYSKYSIPFAPDLFEGRILEDAPERGDIAVFRVPSDGDKDYIKRVIGLPGDKIQMKDAVLYINDEAVPKEFLDDVSMTRPDGSKLRSRRYVETLPNGVTHYTLDSPISAAGENTAVFTVPKGHYFMMGDNRDGSSDSRFGLGAVPLELFVGKAQIIFFSIEPPARARHIWRWPNDVRFDRLMNTL
uniref:signal peptidase I n=1 Tax=Pararhizobium sp. IMCC3301 TaxID=3067904 RepID=UPI0027426006|nr:signal peptidase I [Pararhizobium sp. IMCC3301]